MSVFTVLERLAPHIEREVNLILNSKQEAGTLKSKLEKIQEGMQDAERRGLSDLNVKSWLKELEDVMYQMDDALDKWETKNVELQIEQSEYDDLSDPWEKVRSVLLFLFLCQCFKHVFGRRQITLEMKALSARLDKILKERGSYSFVSNRSDNSQELERPETTSSVDESKIYGRESDKDVLVEFLLSKDEQNGTQVISIVGVGGLGKTTLAQLVYNDPRINQDHFDLKAWVSVPDPFDASRVAKAILESFDKSSSGDSTLENLGQRIKAVVSKQNFLLVLDNVWTVDRTKWESLKNFLVSEPGYRCRILVTTRSEIAARTMGTTHWGRLNLLSDLDCATILNTIALEGRSGEEYEEFCDIGFEIAKKCNGLPLAAKTIGHMLESRFTVPEWENVLESPLWRYGDDLDDIFRPLRLSYMDLSPILKRCFLSCVLYSKGSWLDVAELTRIWMAQGYISSSATWDQVQSKGFQFFKKLFMRSFFQEFRRYGSGEGNITCKMHDVMHEFASYLSKSEYYYILDSRGQNIPMDSIGRVRNFCARSISQMDLPPNFLWLLKCVRVLCMSNCGLRVLPEVVGELTHLRYLDLSANLIKELPETVCDLCNLQTLDLQNCFRFCRLPDGIRKLMNLRHLLIFNTVLEEFPQGFQKLTGLWTLDEFKAKRDSVGYFRNLNQLRGSLNLIVEGLNEAADAEKANLRNKNHIKELKLIFLNNLTVDVIEAMVPPPQLQTLTIMGRPNQQLPSWITTSLGNLKILGINGCDGCSFLPPLGKLPMLETLYIESTKFKSTTLEFLGIPMGTGVGGFPKLKKLQFFTCRMWEEWEDVEEAATAVDSVPVIMPCLVELVISECPNLTALPHRLLCLATSLQELAIYNSDSLESRYHQEFGVDREKISHIPYVNISGWRSRAMEA